MNHDLTYQSIPNARYSNGRMRWKQGMVIAGIALGLTAPIPSISPIVMAQTITIEWDAGHLVAISKRMLRDLGHDIDTSIKERDITTVELIKSYQRKYHLPRSGEPSELFMKSLRRECWEHGIGGSGGSRRSYTIARVKTVQNLLTQAGFHTGGADGLIGGQTLAAIKAFEASRSMPETGRITDALIASLSNTQPTSLKCKTREFCKPSDKSCVNFYNWFDYLDPGVCHEFKRQTGIDIVETTYTSNLELSNVLQKENSGYDIVVPSINYLARHINLHLISQITQTDQIKNQNLGYEKLDDDIRSRITNTLPEGVWGMPYMWGTIGIGYNVDKIRNLMPRGAPVGSLKMIFDPAIVQKFASCGVVIADEGDAIMSTVLRFLEKNEATQDASELEQARKVLESIRPFVTIKSNMIDELAQGKICLFMSFSGDILSAQQKAENEFKNGQQISYVLPDEGGEMWIDMLAIPVDAPHREEALQFMNYLVSPDVISKLSNKLSYANAIKASLPPRINQEIWGDPNIYTPADVRRNRVFLLPRRNDEAIRKIEEVWVSIKAMQGPAVQH